MEAATVVATAETAVAKEAVIEVGDRRDHRAGAHRRRNDGRQHVDLDEQPVERRVETVHETNFSSDSIEYDRSSIEAPTAPARSSRAATRSHCARGGDVVMISPETRQSLRLSSSHSASTGPSKMIDEPVGVLLDDGAVEHAQDVVGPLKNKRERRAVVELIDEPVDVDDKPVDSRYGAN